MSQKRPVKREGLKVKAYPVLCEAIESGVSYGWNRAYKHTETPLVEDTKQAIIDAVVAEICERFDFDDQ